MREALRNVGGGYRDYDTYRIREFESSGFTYLDGLLVDRQQNFQEEPFGLERIEVIQGPVSVLYGQNPPGGLPGRWMERFFESCGNGCPVMRSVRSAQPASTAASKKATKDLDGCIRRRRDFLLPSALVFGRDTAKAGSRRVW